MDSDEEAIRQIMQLYRRTVDGHLKNAFAQGYKGKIYAWLQYEDDGSIAIVVQVCSPGRIVGLIGDVECFDLSCSSTI